MPVSFNYYKKNNPHLIVDGATDISAINGGHECQVLPVLSLEVVKVFVPWSAVPKQGSGFRATDVHTNA